MVLVLFQQHGCSSNHYYGFDNGYFSAWKLITFNKDVEQIQSKVPVVPTSRKKTIHQEVVLLEQFYADKMVYGCII